MVKRRGTLKGIKVRVVEVYGSMTLRQILGSFKTVAHSQPQADSEEDPQMNKELWAWIFV